ncbi:hypothetical protein AIIMSPaA1_021 [Pseudomonas phage AIIMS-Pa-A1]|uniref:Uncharacterized protein n=1 Tax=Pseudomonas phage AIIMS-Pa-A1 TaxID=2794941 RepID=A0A7T1TW56_9CAUD|nr:hypothetical protein AIIMSPaA1_021 [Pseudomonas phage AIIMS-Pa-A1]
MNKSIWRVHAKAGTPSELQGLCWLAIQELEEFTLFRSKDDALNAMLDSIEGNDRTELLVFRDGQLAGGTCIVFEDDPHVGPCVTAQWQYVLPRYRNTGVVREFIRELHRQAGWGQIPLVCWSHRESDSRYTIHYRRAKPYGQESKEGAGQDHHRQTR